MPQGTINKADRGQGVWVHRRRKGRPVLPSQRRRRDEYRALSVGQAVTYEEGPGTEGSAVRKRQARLRARQSDILHRRPPQCGIECRHRAGCRGRRAI